MVNSEPKKSPKLPTSIHIFGPSRSGKSTLENLLGSLPEVHRGFESPLLSIVAKSTFMDSGLPTRPYAYELPTSTDRMYFDNYYKEMARKIGGKKFFTSTSPGRIYDVIKLARIIPKLRIVFVKRDVDDVVYRMYRTLYRTGLTYSYDLDAAREYVNWYYDLQDRYSKLLPNITKTIHYEDMVIDPLKVANEVRQFCGISSEFGDLPEIGDDRGSSNDFKKFAGW